MTRTFARQHGDWGPTPQTRPWTPDALAQLVLTNVGALLVVIAGVYQVTGADDVRARLTWLNLAIVGLIAAGVANGLWLLRARAAVSDAQQVLVLWARGIAEDIGRERPITEALVSEPTMSRFHRPSCPLARGRRVKTGSREEFELAGLSSCEACRP